MTTMFFSQASPLLLFNTMAPPHGLTQYYNWKKKYHPQLGKAACRGKACVAHKLNI